MTESRPGHVSCLDKCFLAALRVDGLGFPSLPQFASRSIRANRISLELNLENPHAPDSCVTIPARLIADTRISSVRSVWLTRDGLSTCHLKSGAIVLTGFVLPYYFGIEGIR